jgi:acyl-CoA thioester hydrolase
MFHVGWGDLDSNGHMKNTSYLDTAADVRMMYFASQGFSMREFERLHVGPVIFRDELEYFRELRLLDPMDVTLAAAALSDDGSRYTLVNEFFTGEGKIAARVSSSGAWLDLVARKLTQPPPEIARAMHSLTRTKDFSVPPGDSPAEFSKR